LQKKKEAEAEKLFKKRELKITECMNTFNTVKNNLNRAVDATIMRYKKDQKVMFLERLKNFKAIMGGEDFLHVDFTVDQIFTR